MPEHEISGLNPVARSESLAAIFSRTDLIQEKKKTENIPEACRQTKIFGRQWRPGDRKFRALIYSIYKQNNPTRQHDRWCQRVRIP
jgi:hypothetical protein